MKYNIELNDEAMDAIFRTILVDDYRMVKEDIKRLKKDHKTRGLKTFEYGDLVNNINLTNHLGIQANFFNFQTFEVFAPPLSGTSFNGETVTINTTGAISIQPSATFNGGSASPTLINENPFAGGVNPTTNPTNQFFTYTSNFDIIVDDELTYENLNPCTPTTVTQTCLSNDDVKKVINSINKIIK